MIKVYQTKFGMEGNCFNACLASILEVSIDKFPDFKDEGTWYSSYQKWLRMYHLDFVMVADWSKEQTSFLAHVFAIVGGTSPRELAHAVVYYKNELIHDPHPDGGGVKNITDWTYIVSKCPKLIEEG